MGHGPAFPRAETNDRYRLEGALRAGYQVFDVYC
jgi:hypothetical protein